MTKLTASEYVKDKGLPSVAYVARKINEHPQRLFEWFTDNFDKFEAVVTGVLSKAEITHCEFTPEAKYKGEFVEPTELYPCRKGEKTK